MPHYWLFIKTRKGLIYLVTSVELMAVLDLIKAPFTTLIELMGSMFTFVLSEPLLIIPIGIVFAYTVVSLFRKIIGL